MVEKRVVLLGCLSLRLLELASHGEQEFSDIGSSVEFSFDPGKDAAAFPVGARFSGATLGLTFGDQLDGAERAMGSFGIHAAILD